MTNQRPETMPATDVIDLLVHQHTLIRELFVQVQTTTGQQRQDAFEQLVRLLAVHETAEEEVVHPTASRVLPAGEAIVGDRLGEEHDAKELLTRLDGMGTEDPEFVPTLEQLRQSVLEHARSEERYEFSWLKQKCTPEQLESMASAVKAAESLAPTHPHPGVETAGKNLLLGTPTAMMDRVRDAIRQATGKPTSGA